MLGQTCKYCVVQVVSLDAVIAPVSGGGMIGGIATVAKALGRPVVVVAAEPTGEQMQAVQQYQAHWVLGRPSAVVRSSV